MDFEIKQTDKPCGTVLDELICLWSDVFGDDVSFINKMIKSEDYSGAVYALYDDHVVGAAHLLSTDGNRKAYYCYAVATDKDYRGKGICTQILNFIKRKCETEGCPFLLHPASASLAQYYSRQGLAPLSYSYWVKCQGDGGRVYDISASEYKRIRDFQFGGIGYYGWSSNVLSMTGLRYVAFDMDGEYMAAAVAGDKVCELCAPVHMQGRAAKRAASVSDEAEVLFFDDSPMSSEVAVMGYNCPEFAYFNLFLN